jgi:FkbM family methyltransferase
MADTSRQSPSPPTPLPSGRGEKEAAAGIARSLAIYYGDPARDAAMDTLYAGFLKPGDLVFDIGAHVGDRIASFRRLGARVVAVEANPALMPTLQELYGADEHVTLVEAAIGAAPGDITMMINTANPTISTASTDFIAAAEGASGWEGQTWDRAITRPQITLDALIAAHGLPTFIKIDIEGYELEALKGLSRPVPALSFEFTTIQRAIAAQCIERLTALAPYAFNLALGESQHLTWPSPVPAMDMLRHISDLPHEANSGDIYALIMDRGEQ